MDEQTLLVVWESANSATEAHARLTEIALFRGIQPLTYGQVVKKACKLRARNLTKKTFPRGRKSLAHLKNQ